jgi:predicted nucleic acid-binding protein
VDAFDADVLIYAAAADHPLGRRVAALFEGHSEVSADAVGIGSVLLLPELLIRPTRNKDLGELRRLAELLGRLTLYPTDEMTARRAVAMGTKYGLHTSDAVHLATAVHMRADRFITNNTRDFSRGITEVDVTYPMDLPDPSTRS